MNNQYLHGGNDVHELRRSLIDSHWCRSGRDRCGSRLAGIGSGELCHGTNHLCRRRAHAAQSDNAATGRVTARGRVPGVKPTGQSNGLKSNQFADFVAFLGKQIVERHTVFLVVALHCLANVFDHAVKNVIGVSEAELLLAPTLADAVEFVLR